MFVIADGSIRQHESPHHLCQHHLLTEIVVTPDLLRETEMIDGRSTFSLRLLEQRPTACCGKTKMPVEYLFEMLTFCVGKFAIGMRDLEQENARSKRYRLRLLRTLRTVSVGNGRSVGLISFPS